jgi:hypothetical protein
MPAFALMNGILQIRRPLIGLHARRLLLPACLSTIGLATAGMVGGAGSAQAQAPVFTDISPPTIAGTTVEGETLRETHATWSTPPSSYADQWERCDSSGNHCQSIEKATAQTYRLTAADVGFTIRVAESASNAAGAVTPSVSAPTEVVRALTNNANSGGQGGPAGGNGPSGSCCSAHAHTSPSAIKALLARQLVPSGKASSIAALLEHAGLGMSFAFPEAGSLTVKWYLLTGGAKSAGASEAKPMLVATGQATLPATKKIVVKIKLTSQGRKALRHAKKIRLEAKGTFTAKGQAAISATRGFSLKR